jgi:anhydro-N-acetylmuramic acid kinase
MRSARRSARISARSAADPAAEKIVTDRHIEAVHALAQQEKLSAGDVEVIGFHGQTVYHNPAQRITVQIGDAARLAKETGIQTVADFRSRRCEGGRAGCTAAAALSRCAYSGR